MFKSKLIGEIMKSRIARATMGILTLVLGYGFSEQTLRVDLPEPSIIQTYEDGKEPLLVRKCEDFDITGDGFNSQWANMDWEPLTKVDKGGVDYPSRFKVLYSKSGIYVLFEGEDDKITTSDYKDMDKIWNGDVFEIFIHPNPSDPMYFEYEVNQFEKQLLLTISNSHKGVSWIPFNEYEKNSYGTFNKVEVKGGEPKLDGKISSWKAEVFLSYKSIGLLPGVPPESGSVWNANFCRLDHDTGKMIKWSWTPSIERSLHELDKFRSIRFE